MSKKILIVDDDPDLLRMVTMRLEANQYEVITAYDGEEGLEKVKAENPDLIILDIVMPKLDGYSFVQEIKKTEHKTIPIIILTAKEEMEDIFKMEGISDYIIKPFDPEELALLLRKHL
jgi:DNA-binding response OmpR family regulator